jgi:uncharacterized protein GlcG (DUF336 family)
MYNQKMLGLAEAEKAIQAILKEARKDPNNKPIAVCVVNYYGHVVSSATMDGTSYFAVWMARRKAYTAAAMRRDTPVFWKFCKDEGFNDSVSSFGTDVTIGPGGANIAKEGENNPFGGYGGIGVGGRTGEEDMELALIGVKAIQDLL